MHDQICDANNYLCKSWTQVIIGVTNLASFVVYAMQFA